MKRFAFIPLIVLISIIPFSRFAASAEISLDADETELYDEIGIVHGNNSKPIASSASTITRDMGIVCEPLEKILASPRGHIIATDFYMVNLPKTGSQIRIHFIRTIESYAELIRIFNTHDDSLVH